MSETPQRAVYVIDCFPERTEPFVLNEVRLLSQRGFSVLVLSVYGRPSNADPEWASRTIYAEPMTSLKLLAAHLHFLLHKPRLYLSLLLRCREFRGKRVFWKSVYFAKEALDRDIRHVHAHFAWVATDAARLICALTGASYSLTAHQSDINRSADANLGEKLHGAKFIVTCTEGNREALLLKFGDAVGRKTRAIHHGTDISVFDGRPQETDAEVDILSIGSLIEVKGFDTLIRACAALRSRGRSFRCRIVGGGPEAGLLRSLAFRLGLEGIVEFTGPVPHDRVRALYSKAKLFVLPVVVVDGAPHGIPNVLMEAMAMGLPVIASRVPDIPELIEHGRDGLLVKERDVEALADAIDGLLSNGPSREELGRNARAKIEADFDSRRHVRTLAESMLDLGATA